MTVLGPETLLYAKDVSQTGQTRLQEQLTALRQIGFGAVIVKFEQRRPTLDRGLDDAGRGDLEDGLFSVEPPKSGQECRADPHDRRRGLGTQVEMTETLTDRGIGVFVEERGVGFGTGGGSTDHLPPIGGELVSARSGLALGYRLELTSDLNGTLGDEVEGVERLVQVTREDELEVAGSVTQGDKGHLSLLTETMNPTEHADTLVTVFSEVSDLDLRVDESQVRRLGLDGDYDDDVDAGRGLTLGAAGKLVSSTKMILAASSRLFASLSSFSLSAFSMASLFSSAFFTFFQWASTNFLFFFNAAPLMGCQSLTSGESGLRTRIGRSMAAVGEGKEVSMAWRMVR